MLTVDVDQVVSRFTQLRNRGRAAIDPRPAFALRVDRAAQEQAVLFVGAGCKPGFFKPGRQAGRHIELGTDLGACRTFAHHARIAPTAQCELQRVDQDRLARASLAGQHREAGIEP